MIRIGTAGWTIPSRFAGSFPHSGSSIQRYAGSLQAAEINSSFYRSHKPETYRRWAASVPDDFRFAVKLPREITHEKRLVASAERLAAFLDEASDLGGKLGPLLIQLPPSLAFEAPVAAGFLESLRLRTDGPAACEPRHATWFDAEASTLLRAYGVARVAADPARVPEAALPGGSPDLQYYRVHGSPRMYYSEYDAEFLAGLARKLVASEAAETWCIFDNTTSGAAAGNALALEAQVASLTRRERVT